MSRTLPKDVDTVIVGSGPSSLILSYILHGNIPSYSAVYPHPDPLLDQKLRKDGDLLNANVDQLTEHFSASRFPYSTQALPVNVLLDTLIRPHGETDDTANYTCVKWKYRPEKAVKHVVIGDTHCAGGQWVDNPVEASWDIETLSYAGMLSLPGYTFAEHYERTRGASLPPFQRPSRRQVASYFAEYPEQVGIEDAFHYDQPLDGILKTKDGFYIESHRMACKHLVLATGIFSQAIPPRPLLKPLASLPKSFATSSAAPLLVIGSGFSAADIIISAPPHRKVLHIYKWAPNTTPSPLRACHQQAYPDYAGIYRRMKLAATSRTRSKSSKPKLKKAPSSAFDLSRDWEGIYEGLPNTAIVDVKVHGETATITCQSAVDEATFEREVSGLAYVVGRRGSLTYLSDSLQSEVLERSSDAALISGQTLRQKSLLSTEVANNVFIIGSLTGDSLVRFAYGGCTFAAGQIMALQGQQHSNARGRSRHLANSDTSNGSMTGSGSSSPTTTNRSSASSPSRVGFMNGLDGHNNVRNTNVGMSSNALGDRDTDTGLMPG